MSPMSRSTPRPSAARCGTACCCFRAPSCVPMARRRPDASFSDPPLWAAENLNLLYQTTRAAFLAQEKHSALGMLWHLLNPLLTTVVLYAVFSNIMRANQVAHYPLFILAGLIQFNFFAHAT